MNLTKRNLFLIIILLLTVVLISQELSAGNIYGSVFRYEMGGIPPGYVYSAYWPDTLPRVIKLVRPGGSVAKVQNFRISPLGGNNYNFQSSENYVGFKLYAVGVKQSGNLNDGTWVGIEEVTQNSGRFDVQMYNYLNVNPTNFIALEGYGYPNPFGGDPEPANHLYWDSPSTSLPVDGFIIERRESGTSIWQQLTTIGSNNTSFMDADLTDGNIYEYLIKSFFYYPINEGPIESNGSMATATALTVEISGPSSLEPYETGIWYANTNVTFPSPSPSFSFTWRERINNIGTYWGWLAEGSSLSRTVGSGNYVWNLRVEVYAAGTTTIDYHDVSIGQENCSSCHENSSSELMVQSEEKFCPASVTSQYSSTELLKEISLLQNYPNPFNPITQIKFVLPTDQNVSLRIYNYLGQEISTIYKNKFLNAGYHEVNFDGNNLSSGVYLYILEGENQSSEKVKIFKKMFLLK